MIQEKGTEIIREYLDYADEHYKEVCGDAYFHKRNEEDFLIIEAYNWGRFLRDFNNWLEQSEYYQQLLEETVDRQYDDYWIDYLTNGNFGNTETYYVCTECDEVILANPSSGHRDNYWITEGSCLCEKCVRENADEYISEYLVVNYDKGVPEVNLPLNQIFTHGELYERGFEVVKEDLELGFYGTYNDHRFYLKKYTEKFKDTDFICHCTEQNPFMTRYDIYARGDFEDLYIDYYKKVFTYEEMKQDAKENYDYGDPTNFLTYMKDWWKENYRKI